jgi:hypothetical protein
VGKVKSWPSNQTVYCPYRAHQYQWSQEFGGGGVCAGRDCKTCTKDLRSLWVAGGGVLAVADYWLFTIEGVVGV